MQGDHWRCNCCEYEWIQKKPVGSPHQCPSCREKNISNLLQNERHYLVKKTKNAEHKIKLDKHIKNAEHTEAFEKTLKKLKEEGGDIDGFVIFNLVKKPWYKQGISKNAPFVQFAQKDNNILTLYFPKNSSYNPRTSFHKLGKLLKSVNSEFANEDDGIYVNFTNTKLAAAITHLVFLKVFDCNENYKINTELYL